MINFQHVLDAFNEGAYSMKDRGRMADHILELAKDDLHKFGIHLLYMKQVNFSAGDSVEQFSIQSIAKAFNGFEPHCRNTLETFRRKTFR